MRFSKTAENSGPPGLQGRRVREGGREGGGWKVKGWGWRVGGWEGGIEVGRREGESTHILSQCEDKQAMKSYPIVTSLPDSTQGSFVL